MGTVSISALEEKKEEYQRELTSARRSLANTEDAYESLVEFKGKVKKNHESFNSLTKTEEGFLEDLDPYYDCNKCAKAFVDTLRRFLKGAADDIVGASYRSLLTAADAMTRNYYEKIDDLNDDILYYKEKIEDIEEEIKYQQGLEVQV